MGFCSWECAVSGESIANKYSSKPKEQTQCYLVTPKNTYYEDNYEGYGVFGGVDVYELLGNGDREKGINNYYNKDKQRLFDVKVILKKHYKGQNYQDLPISNDCYYQGYFYE